MRRCGQLLQNAPRHVQHSQSARKFSAVLGTTSANSSCSTPGDEWWGGRWGREAGGVAREVGLGEVCVCRRGAAPGSGGLLLPLLHVGGAVCSASGRSTSALAGGTAAATRRSLAPPHLPFPPPPAPHHHDPAHRRAARRHLRAWGVGWGAARAAARAIPTGADGMRRAGLVGCSPRPSSTLTSKKTCGGGAMGRDQRGSGGRDRGGTAPAPPRVPWGCPL